MSPDLAKAVGLSQKEMMRLQKSVGDFNKLAAKSQLAMAGILPPTTKVTAAIKKTNDEANALADTFKRIGEIAAGVSIGSMIEDGLQRAVDLGKELVSQGVEFAKKASEAASSFELLSAGMGNLLRSQPLANAMLDKLQNMANYSPFQLTDVGATARSLIARGVDPNQVVHRTGQLGDIVAGLGGGRGELDRATLAYGEAMSGDTLNSREINQLTELGVPVWAELKKFTGKTVEELHKMIEKHEISSQWLNKIMGDLTGPDGIFFHGMLNFANTFQGIISTFNDKWGQGLRDVGNIVNDFIKGPLSFINDSGAWQTAHEYFLELRKMAQSVESFISTLPSSALWGKFQPYIDGMEKAFGSVNNFIGQFFTEVTDPVSGTHWALNATGDSKVQEILDDISTMFEEVAKFVTSKSVQDLASFGWSSLQQGLKDMFTGIEEMADLLADVLNRDWIKLGADIKKYEYDKPEHDNLIDSIIPGRAGYTNWGNSAGGVPTVVINGKTYSDEDNQLYYEHLSEGYSSSHGPHHNPLGVGFGIGIGKSKQAETGAYFGKFVRVRLPNGSTIIRQVNERSARDHGIELVTPDGDESSYGTGKATIEGVYNTKEDAEKANSSSSSKSSRSTKDTPIADTHVHFHINAIDGASVHGFLSDHGDSIADTVHRHLRSRSERYAVV